MSMLTDCTASQNRDIYSSLGLEWHNQMSEYRSRVPELLRATPSWGFFFWCMLQSWPHENVLWHDAVSCFAEWAHALKILICINLYCFCLISEILNSRRTFSYFVCGGDMFHYFFFVICRLSTCLWRYPAALPTTRPQAYIQIKPSVFWYIYVYHYQLH